jgi:hypothetical protein
MPLWYFSWPFWYVVPSKSGNPAAQIFVLVYEGEMNLLVDEGEEQVLQLCRVVGPVDDVAIVLVIELGLSAELAAKELGRI